jgi:hypothetical protein
MHDFSLSSAGVDDPYGASMFRDVSNPDFPDCFSQLLAQSMVIFKKLPTLQPWPHDIKRKIMCNKQ